MKKDRLTLWISFVDAVDHLRLDTDSPTLALRALKDFDHEGASISLEVRGSNDGDGILKYYAEFEGAHVYEELERRLRQ